MAWNTFSCTGEGGYIERLFPYKDHMITQVATGLFGVREETIQMAPIVEFKYAQGAKPGLGGHLLGDKNTPAVAAMREAVAGTSLFSPFPFHSVYSIEDHKKHVDWIKHMNPTGAGLGEGLDADRRRHGGGWIVSTRARISSTSTAATAAPALLPRSPRRTSRCPSNTRFPRSRGSWKPRGFATT